MKAVLNNFLLRILSKNNISITEKNQVVLDSFIEDEDNLSSMQIILGEQEELKKRIMSKLRIFEITNQHIQIPNATVGKKYEAKVDFVGFGWNDIIYSDFEGLTENGLVYDNQTEIISGIPTQSGDFKIRMKFRVKGEEDDSTLNEKVISLIINADPKSLWKNLPSNVEDKFWKEDNVSDFQKIGAKHIVVSSKRGRSHANVGSFRDDHYAFKHFDQSNWSIVAVSDGAGSAKASRKGSEIACNEVVDYFEKNLTLELSKSFDDLMQKHQEELKNPIPEKEKTAPSENVGEANTGDEALIVETQVSTKNEISKFIYNNLGACAKSVYNKLEEFATKNEFNIKELHSTLIFSLFKKYDFGYVILTFGVGDCPIGVLSSDKSEFKLMNWLDVGEFGGGTRFITMPEIFTSEKFATRFGFKIMDDFSFLFLMTDGIYDAKFVVESNLEKLEKWTEFIADLEGQNEDHAKVVFDPSNPEIANQLSTWMDFWSPGNHDDRTLAVIF